MEEIYTVFLKGLGEIVTIFCDDVVLEPTDDLWNYIFYFQGLVIAIIPQNIVKKITNRKGETRYEN